MRRALALLLLAASLAPALTPVRAQVPEAAEYFRQRQEDLVALARHLGGLHRLRQVCYPEDSPDLFRRRLLALVPLEAPMGGTRLDMVAGFNAGYREASNAHGFCGDEARAAYAGEAEAALAVVERLYAPFR